MEKLEDRYKVSSFEAYRNGKHSLPLRFFIFFTVNFALEREKETQGGKFKQKSRSIA